jgi:hypothetical protein
MCARRQRANQPGKGIAMKNPRAQRCGHPYAEGWWVVAQKNVQVLLQHDRHLTK